MADNVIIRETVTAGIRRYTLDQQRRATSAMVKAGNSIKTAAQRRLVHKDSPGGPGGRDTGHLARSIISRLIRSTPSEIVVRVGPGVKYAKWVEGQPIPKRHALAIAILLPWLQRHPAAMAKIRPGQKYVMVGGPQSTTPYMRPAADEVVPTLITKLAAALKA